MCILFEIDLKPGISVQCLKQNTLTEPFLLFPLLSSPCFFLVASTVHSIHVTWYFKAILSGTGNFSSSRILYFKLLRTLLSTCNPPPPSHPIPAPKEHVQMPLTVDNFLRFPKCLENNRLVSPIVLLFSYDYYD